MSITKADLARGLRLTRARVSQLAKRGMPLFSVEAAENWRRQHVRPRPGTNTAAQAATGGALGVGDTSPPASFDVSRARREASEADLAGMRADEMGGALVRRADVENASFAAARQLRDGLTNCARRIGAEVAPLSAPDECTRAIEREHRLLLQSWAKTMARQAPGADLGAVVVGEDG